MPVSRIILLTLYYGEFPWYFPYFLHSCRYNPEIDFLILSETVYGGKLPVNVTIVNKPLADIQRMASEKLGFEVNLDTPNKICDLKPAYGFLLPEYIENYDFWGYCDIDIILGNIRGFITESVLKEYDVISVLSEFLSGFFAIYRNDPFTNQLFKQSKDYREVFSSRKHYCFDECNFLFWQVEEGTIIEKMDGEIESMTHVVNRLREQKAINVLFDAWTLQGTAGKLKWEDGILTYRNQYEIMIYHLIKLKEICKTRTPKKMSRSFRISPTRIY